MRVLVATDLSRSAEQATSLVASLRWPAGSSIHVLAVIEPITGAVTLVPDSIAPAYTDAMQREFALATEAVVRKLRAEGREVMSVIKFGRAADVIIKEADRLEANLIVLGSRGRGAVRSALLGSVSAEIVDRAVCPVLVARRDGVSRIVFGDDGTSRTRQAAEVLRWPVFAGIPVRVVSTAEVSLPYEAVSEDRATFDEAVRGYLERARAAREAAERVVKESAARLLASGIAATTEVRDGAAAAGLLAAADGFGADLIVVGSRGDRGLTRMLVGSTAREVLYHAAPSVLIAKQLRQAGAVAGSVDGRLAGVV